MLHVRGEVVEPELGDLRKHHAFSRQPVAEHHIEGTDAIGCNDKQRIFAAAQGYIVKIPHLAGAFVGEIQISL